MTDFHDDDDTAPLYDPEHPDGRPDEGPYYASTSAALGHRIEVQKIIDLLDGRDQLNSLVNIVTARFVDQHCRGHMNDDVVDSMVAAALCAGQDLRGIIAQLPDYTEAMARNLGFYADDLFSVTRDELSVAEACLYESYLTARLELASNAHTLQLFDGHDPDDIAVMPRALETLSAIAAAGSPSLSGHAVKAFNAAAAADGQAQRVTLATGNVIRRSGFSI